MRFGIIGLGRIGGALARQALEKGHQVVGHNRSPVSTQFWRARDWSQRGHSMNLLISFARRG
jgi:3-hydroxyisobutyrate dehydrogenase-like beta-hydroxyacid dehydrogenase